MPKKLQSRTGRDEKKRKTQERMERGSIRDLHVLGVRRCRELEADGKKWKDIVRQAKAQGAVVPMEEEFKPTRVGYKVAATLL